MLGYICSIGSAVLYGCLPLLAKGIYASGASELMVVALRFSLAALPAFLLMRWNHVPLGVTKKELGALFIMAQGYILTASLLFFSYSYIPSGMSTTLHFMYPVIVLAIGTLVFREKLNATKLTCAALGVAGVFFFYTPGGAVSGFGILLAFASACTYAFYVVFDERSGMVQMNPYKLCFFISLFCGLEASAAAALRGEMRLSVLTSRAWGLAFLLSFGSTVFAIVLVQIGIRLIGAEKCSFLSTFEPLTSVVIGIAVMGEKLTVRTGAGIVCILVSALVLALENGKKKE